MNPFAERVRRAIGMGLPGTEVQWEMASSDRMIQNYPRHKNSGSRIAAVLILLYPIKGRVHTVFIQRPVYSGIHSGQISFPGGKVEAVDSNIIATALRETAEETGVQPDSVTILGTLSPLYIYVSDTEVTPVVGWCDNQPRFMIDTAEVVHIIEADMASFADKSIVMEKPFTIREAEINVKHYDYNGAVIWGATAMILRELMTILEREGASFTL